MLIPGLYLGMAYSWAWTFFRGESSDLSHMGVYTSMGVISVWALLRANTVLRRTESWKMATEVTSCTWLTTDMRNYLFGLYTFGLGLNAILMMNMLLSQSKDLH